VPVAVCPAGSFGRTMTEIAHADCRPGIAATSDASRDRSSVACTLQLSNKTVSETTVIDKLGFLVRFWQLRARHASRGEPLTAAEQLELLSLMQLVTSDLRMPAPGACPRPSNAIAGQLIGEGRVLPVEVRQVCAAAVVVGCRVRPTPGEHVILRAADAVSGVEYVLPCSIEWVYGGSQNPPSPSGGAVIAALVVDGVPTQSELLAASETLLHGFATRRPTRLAG
jgi:hypothetical protein